MTWGKACIALEGRNFRDQPCKNGFVTNPICGGLVTGGAKYDTPQCCRTDYSSIWDPVWDAMGGRPLTHEEVRGRPLGGGE
jgi:hypothetical protein